MVKEIPKKTYEKPELTKEGTLSDITAAVFTVIIKPD